MYTPFWWENQKIYENLDVDGRISQEVRGKTNHLLSFDMARTAQKTKKLGGYADTLHVASFLNSR
jgi:hypothetical protein